MLRAAVLQVVSHLVARAVPPAERVPLFDQAEDLLDEAGWGLDELTGALERGPAQDALLSALGLLELDLLTALTRPTRWRDMTDQRRYRRHRMPRAPAPTTRAPPCPPHAADVPAWGQGHPGPPQPFSIPAPREQFSAPGHGRGHEPITSRPRGIGGNRWLQKLSLTTK
jgi:hypothetical protein